MRRVRIRLPAAAARFGVGQSGLGLALGLYIDVEITERGDDQLIVETAGEDTGHYALGLRHPVVVGMTHIFQHLERAAPGLNVHIDSKIPIAAGLGAETAFRLAGMIGANNLFSGSLTRQQIMTMAAQALPVEQVAPIMLGGLTSSVMHEDRLITRTLPVSSFRMVLMLPLNAAAPQQPTPESRVALADALYNLRLMPLLMEALRTGDLELFSLALRDRLFDEARRRQIPAYDDIVDFAQRWGSRAVTFAGDGCALLFFPDRDADKLKEALEAYCDDEALPVRLWTLGIDTQGVVVSVASSS